MKKIFSVILSMIILNLNLIPVMAETTNEIVAIEESEAEATTEDLSYEDYLFLSGIGFLDNININFSDLSTPITRAEFASLAVKLATKEFVTDITDDFFMDVPANHSSAAAIYTGVDKGIIAKGDTFNPNENTTLIQADKMVIEALGYGMIADFSGGWENGYYAQASDLKLNKGIKSGYGEITKYDALKIIRNALDVDLMQPSVGKVGSITYEAIDGETVLTELYDIYKVEGVVTSNGLADLNSDNAGDVADYAVINNVKFDAGTSSICEYLGQYVNAYYLDDEDDYTILYAESDDKKNTVITVMADEIGTYSNNVFKYENELGRVKTLKTTPALKVIYNGRRIVDYTNAHILINSGELTFIDNNSDGVYDVAIVYKSSTYYVDSVNKSAFTVIDGKSSTTQRILNLDSENKVVRIFNDQGVLSDFEAIVPDTVITVFESINNDYAEVYTRYSVVETAIRGLSSENGVRTISTDDADYTVSLDYTRDIKLGDKRYLYLDAYGHVAYIDREESELRVGYLLDYRVTVDDEEYIKVLTDEDENIKLMLSEKVKVDNVKLENASPTILWDGTRKPILYKLNAEGLVVAIYTPQNSTSKTAELRKVYSTSDGIYGGVDELNYYSSGNGMFEVIQEMRAGSGIYQRYFSASEIVFFAVPENPATANTDDYFIYDASGYNPGLVFPAVTLYSFADTNLISICEVKTEESEQNIVWAVKPYAVVNNLVQTINEDDELVYSFTDVTSGKQMYYEPNNTNIPQLHNGDMIMFSVESKTGYIKFVKVLYCSETDDAYTAVTGVHGVQAVRGTITNVEGNVVEIILKSGDKVAVRVEGKVFDTTEVREPKETNISSLTVGENVVFAIVEGRVKLTLVVE